MYIGRIITKGKNLETLDFVEVTTKFEKGDNSIPTLIIGKENAEKIYGKENIHVLDKKIEDNVYWTFGKLERRNDFERDLQSFNKLLLDNLLGSNIFNILFILGLIAIIKPLYIKKEIILKNYAFALLSCLVLFIISYDIYFGDSLVNLITRTEGILLLCFAGIFLY